MEKSDWESWKRIIRHQFVFMHIYVYISSRYYRRNESLLLFQRMNRKQPQQNEIRTTKRTSQQKQSMNPSPDPLAWVLTHCGSLYFPVYTNAIADRYSSKYHGIIFLLRSLRTHFFRLCYAYPFPHNSMNWLCHEDFNLAQQITLCDWTN